MYQWCLTQLDFCQPIDLLPLFPIETKHNSINMNRREIITGVTHSNVQLYKRNFGQGSNC